MVAKLKASAAEVKTAKPFSESLPPIELSDNARQVLEKRYVRRGDDGKPAESVEEMFWRVAYNVALVETDYNQDVESVAREYYTLLTSKAFFPNSPTFTGAGTPLGQLAACFVLPISDDMGRQSTGIFQTLRDAALIQQTGGGNGFSFSRLRPEGTLVKSSAGQATGPVGFLRVYDHAFGEVAQGGSRRGANMAVLRVDHPDIESFVTCKTNENSIVNFNISVGITDAFMRAVENDEMWDLRFPDVSSPLYRGFNGTLEEAEAQGVPVRVYKTIPARDLFNKIVQQAHHNGEPGMLFIDAANRSNPVPHLYALEATNPCGEQWLGPYENCCLGSINLAQHLAPDGKVDWEKLRYNTELAVRFLDDVVDANKYVPAVPQLKEAAHRARRIGLGIMGLADLMYHTGIRYGSTEGQEFASQVMEFVRYHAMRTSIDLARARGAFPAIKGSIYDPDAFRWQAPEAIVAYENDWGRPEVDWTAIVNDIKTYGIRNAAQTTVAPTGTIATVAGCEGYGCEPVFALAYIRHVNDNGKDLQLTYASPLFKEALNRANIPAETQQAIFEKVMRLGSVKEINEVPADIRDVFAVSADISAEEHVYMQAALQAFVDNSLSKTINFPPDASEEDVAHAYLLAWNLGCKGITVYVTGSREKVVLDTVATLEKKQQPEKEASAEAPLEAQQHILWRDSKKPRPRWLAGFTYNIDTPLGKAFITINENGGNQPFEVFINTAKAGSDTAAVSEAIGRLVSYILRLSSAIEPTERLREVIRQLSGIGGGRPLGFGPNRVRSLPDGVAQSLEDYIKQRAERLEAGILHPTHAGAETAPKNGGVSLNGNGNGNGHHTAGEGNPLQQPPLFKIGDLCPECGEAAVVNEEGCRKCYACGHSEC
ncbi:MAG: adenosylcobalamin-dependent ribonucleoside-diphosphate reductase [Anaerolineae bacterium]|nr:adenosylcobalamin-dependent ribonucleoside-diphosphate reductase [Anaerolineae bacterium]